MSSGADPSRCVVLTPAARYIEPHCDLSLRQLESAGYTVRRWFGGSLVDVLRNRLATQALADGFEELMWIDSDIAFDPSSVDRLRAHALPLVCGMYPTKIECLPTWVEAPGASAAVAAGASLLEIHYAGCGFFLARAEVFREVQRRENLPVCNSQAGDPMVPYFLPMVIERHGAATYLEADYAFCERARRAGFQIFADPAVILQHIGLCGYFVKKAPLTAG